MLACQRFYTTCQMHNKPIWTGRLYDALCTLLFLRRLYTFFVIDKVQPCFNMSQCSLAGTAFFHQKHTQKSFTSSSRAVCTTYFNCYSFSLDGRRIHSRKNCQRDILSSHQIIPSVKRTQFPNYCINS